ncbi:MAG: peptide chain release factor N(5)-glutamine methyltransferase, partial [Myxococcales bacterium]
GEQGLDVLRRIVGEASDWLTPDGLFATEIDPGQAAAVLALCTQASLCGTKVVRDLAGLDRHVVARAARR